MLHLVVSSKAHFAENPLGLNIGSNQVHSLCGEAVGVPGVYPGGCLVHVFATGFGWADREQRVENDRLAAPAPAPSSWVQLDALQGRYPISL